LSFFLNSRFYFKTHELYTYGLWLEISSLSPFQVKTFLFATVDIAVHAVAIDNNTSTTGRQGSSWEKMWNKLADQLRNIYIYNSPLARVSKPTIKRVTTVKIFILILVSGFKW